MTESSSPKLRVVIVDDEELSRAVIREYLSAHSDIEIIGECANGFEAVRAVNDLGPDLLFLDIQMPKLTGFEVLELIGDDVGVVFITAYDEYALKAFQVHALDYLLKPFSRERLDDALVQVRSKRGPTQVLSEGPARIAADARPPDRPLDRVVVRSGPKVEIIPVARIDYIKAQDDYVAFVVEGREVLKHQTLSDLEGQLAPDRFVRIHRSHIINLDRLARIELYSKNSYVAILRDGTRLAVSRSGHTRLQELL